MSFGKALIISVLIPLLTAVFLCTKYDRELKHLDNKYQISKKCDKQLIKLINWISAKTHDRVNLRRHLTCFAVVIVLLIATSTLCLMYRAIICQTRFFFKRVNKKCLNFWDLSDILDKEVFKKITKPRGIVWFWRELKIIYALEGGYRHGKKEAREIAKVYNKMIKKKKKTDIIIALTAFAEALYETLQSTKKPELTLPEGALTDRVTDWYVFEYLKNSIDAFAGKSGKYIIEDSRIYWPVYTAVFTVTAYYYTFKKIKFKTPEYRKKQQEMLDYIKHRLSSSIYLKAKEELQRFYIL